MYITKQIQNNLLKKKNSLHQRSILREMMSTCDKLNATFLTKKQSRFYQSKQKLEKIQNLDLNSTLSQLNLKQNTTSKSRYSHDPFRSTPKQEDDEQGFYVKESRQFKQIKDLRKKMLPKVTQTVIEKKLKQLTFIRNLGYKTTDKALEKFKSWSREKDVQAVLDRSWEEFFQDKFNFTAAKSQQNSPKKKLTYLCQGEKKNCNFATHNQGKSELELNNENNIISDKISVKPQTNFLSQFSTCDNSCVILDHNQSATKGNDKRKTPKNKQKQTIGDFSLMQNIDMQDIQLKDLENLTGEDIMKGRRTNRQKTKFRETIRSVRQSQTGGSFLVKDQMSPHYTKPGKKSKFQQKIVKIPNLTNYKLTKKSKKQKISANKKEEQEKTEGKRISTPLSPKIYKDLLQIPKQVLEQENAQKLYSLVKGGYALADPNQLEGQYISLKRFKEAREQFPMLENFYQKVKQNRYIFQPPQVQQGSESFRSFVYLAQMNNKLPPSYFKKIQTKNKVVN